ncbi:MAG TPA: IS1595 family transposase [Candidatus Sulfotelmatobacter sp.]|nr:IS1595 family transposase [Candidatus Sulfotelmatobacter sp.]
MDRSFSFSKFLTLFPNDNACLEEIKKQRFPYGVYCYSCGKITKHYKIRSRTAYSCASCRKHFYPLSGTIFEKSSTSLRIWFFALFLMTQTRGALSKKQLQQELGVTYKTAWRIHRTIYILMEQRDGDLLKNIYAFQKQERKWLFFNKFEIKVVQKQEPSEDEENI